MCVCTVSEAPIIMVIKMHWYKKLLIYLYTTKLKHLITGVGIAKKQESFNIKFMPP